MYTWTLNYDSRICMHTAVPLVWGFTPTLSFHFSGSVNVSRCIDDKYFKVKHLLLENGQYSIDSLTLFAELGLVNFVIKEW